ncbi:cold shock domain-containing protein C2 [Hydra vulgaris]|nr:cold shock domain-containing protein C2 [Hydra vulgaris]
MSTSNISLPVDTETPTKEDVPFAVPLSPKHISTRHRQFSIPSPIPCRRTRTTSVSKMAAESDLLNGTVVSFCREKGHGFVKPDNEERNVFLHISDIEDEYVVQTGDRVEFRTIPMPPKCVERMAVEVRLIELDKHKPHQRWDNKSDF